MLTEPAPPHPAPPPTDPSAGHPLRGVVLLLCALFLFACMDTSIKILTADHSVPMVVAIRYIVHCLLMVVLFAPSQGRKLVQTQRTGLVLVRAASLTAASLFVGLALQRMPVAEMTAITFLAPMLVVLLAGPLLRERIGPVGWTAAVAGFAGVLLVVRPGGAVDPAGLAFMAVAVAANTTYQLLTRILADTDRAVAMLFYTALVGSICFGALLPWFWDLGDESLPTVLLFLSTGVTAGLGHYLFTLAYRDAPASMLAPMNYLQLLWAGLLGWMVFGHIPDALSAAGMVVIAASGALIALKSRRPARRA